MDDLRRRLLAWYDANRRELPWRARPGEPRDPYRVWVSEIMLQQTTVAATIPYYGRFVARFPTLAALAAADLEDVLRLWAGLGYYARARNLHACARTIVVRHDGQFPHTTAELRALPGIGDYTAAAIAAIAFDASVVPVDGNIERVIARLFAIGEPLPGGKAIIKRAAEQLAPMQRPGDFAQALMDLGATLCTPRSPACPRCPLRADCKATARGDAEVFPVKAAKGPGRLRRGAAFVVMRDDGCVLLRTRAAHGLLGGMTEAPTTEWTHSFDEKTALAHAPALSCPPARIPGFRGRLSAGGSARQRLEPGEGIEVQWRRAPGRVRHVFTHFPLELSVYVARVAAGTPPPDGMRWAALADLDGEALPNLMRKVIAYALDDFELRGRGSAAARAVSPSRRAARRAAHRSE